MITGSLREELRNATRPWHEALEKSLDILNPANSREHYTQVLQKFYGYYQPIEQAIPAYAAGSNRAKLKWLREDLLSLGQSPQRVDALPICDQTIELLNPAQQFGCMYVLEGSTLGGQYVCRHLAEAFGLSAGNGASFFNSYGDRVGIMWQRFVAEMEDQFASSATRATVVSSAIECFKSLHEWLQH